MPPFTVLHVCMGNICRSPMAERLLTLAVTQAGGDPGYLYSHSAGTGGWHEGEEMNPPAARLVKARGGDPQGFAARKLRADHIDAADLILTATADQQEYVVALRPDAADRTFVLGEFGRLLSGVDAAALPAANGTPEEFQQRGAALVAAVDALRAGQDARSGDDLDDPWGRGDSVFGRVADEITDTLDPLVRLLFAR
ncbi:protein-tyrosine phosphatase [Allocatelliglobosispora scoriae]|uniref:protein-tyrosine-phosphatase n=1 Tax=Allocatelliglobosispora scoriae TaxID=643052 RepID=A0A841BV08_9ACTN|nr:phosphotyrosine protein phosphatase [Allocatelliglobosispora scoriae]MBB5872034.1 protein-tyrosine phosphatase [Allocatelliglobosispora scoriae]